VIHGNCATLARVSLVDVVIVSYNSSASLRRCVEPLVAEHELNVIVADNASTDGSLETIRDLEARALPLERNGGFAFGCNAGWRAGSSPYVLFLNPDARIPGDAIRRLAAVLDHDDVAAAAAPRIVHADGTLDFSQRRFPRLVSTYAQALFLHRLFPRAAWTDEVVRDVGAYERSGTPEWVSGACILVRRSALEALHGFDDGFFMYCEDIDLCRRIRDAGWAVRFEPEATCVHEGGGSGDRSLLLPVLTRSRIRYARLHHGWLYGALERAGIALGALTHLVAGKGGRRARLAQARSLRAALTRAPTRKASQEAR
jgi:N-acetylglucosaminyl-diphospho-decaprenol L-rhamnosyltransferase